MTLDIGNPLIFFLCVVGAFLLGYLKSYGAEKGKNLATKQDVKEITLITESVKTELLNQTEQLKAQLTIYRQNKLSLKQVERDAILKYCSCLNVLVESLLATGFGGYTIDSYNLIENEIKNLDLEFRNYSIASADLDLFFYDKDFKDKRFDLMKAIILWRMDAVSELIKLKSHFELGTIKIDMQPDPAQKSKLKLSIIQEGHGLVRSAKEEGPKQYAVVHPQRDRMLDLLLVRLRQISDE